MPISFGRFYGRPQNYEELRKLALQEVEDKVAELEEHLVALREFAYGYVENITDHDSLEQALLNTDLHEYNDAKDFKALFEIADNWPAVSWPRGTGYW